MLIAVSRYQVSLMSNMRVVLGSSSALLSGVITIPLLYLMLVFCIRPQLSTTNVSFHHNVAHFSIGTSLSHCSVPCR